MLKMPIVLSTVFLLSACVSVPVNPDGSRQYGETRQFSRVSGTSMNVTRMGSTVEVVFASEAPPSQSELSNNVQMTTGCLPGDLISSRSTYYNRATWETYALMC